MWESYLKREKNGKFANDFFIAFLYPKIGKSSLFCCNGYRHAIFRIIFKCIISRISKKSLYKRTKWKKKC